MFRSASILAGALALLSGCDPLEAGEGDELTFRAASTGDFNYYWQPFSKSSVWNLKLSPTRSETPIPAAALAVAPMAASDAAYGIKVYVAKSSDPLWRISCGNYDSYRDVWPSPCPITVRAPAGMTPPSGSDGTVIVVDETLGTAHEMWQFRPQGGTNAYASGIAQVNLRSDGIHRNVGVTGSGLPGVGGLLKTYETKNNVTIRHKLWVAAHPDLLYPQAVWPAPRYDATSTGRYAMLRYGDVIALGKGVDVNNTGCNLSPFMKRIAKALQDYGGIIQDRGGDSLGFAAEVDSIRDYIDIDYNSKMWEQFACLKKFMVKVNDPWNGAAPGGLGFDAVTDTTGPTAPAGLVGSAPSATAAQLDWVDASDNVGVAGYQVLRDGQVVGTTTASQYADSNLKAATRYSYAVRAYDAVGNQSALSAAVAVTTPASTQAPAQLLGNGGFEGGAAPWSLQPWSASSQVRLCTDRARSGGRSLCVTNPSKNDGAAVHPIVPVTAGRRYQASAWLLLQGVSGGEGLLMVDWFAANQSYLSSAESPGRAASTSAWVQESLTATAPPGAAYAMIFLYSYATGTVYFDDASFQLAP